MKNYDSSINYGVHTVQITIQQWNYVGHIIQYVNGNCKGREVLDFDFRYEDADMINDCKLLYNENVDIFSAILTRSDGHVLKVKGNAEEFNDMIVSVEIIDFDTYDNRKRKALCDC